jgi:hypothetical protein
MSAYLHSNINMSMVGTKAQWLKEITHGWPDNRIYTCCSYWRICHWPSYDLALEVLAFMQPQPLPLRLTSGNGGATLLTGAFPAGYNEVYIPDDGILAESGVYVSAFTGTGGIMTIMLN